MTLRNILRINSVKFSYHLVGYRARYACTTENDNDTLAREIALVLVYPSQMNFMFKRNYKSLFDTLWKHSECRTHIQGVARQLKSRTSCSVSTSIPGGDLVDGLPPDSRSSVKMVCRDEILLSRKAIL